MHTYFSTELAYKDLQFMYVGDNASLVKQEIETHMQSWLGKHEFAAELVDCFSDTQQPG